VILGFEEAVVGLETGQETKTIIKCDSAYGHIREDLVMEFQRSDFPEDLKLRKKLSFKPAFGNDMTMNVEITHISDDIVIVDGNHPLAGKDLIFNIKLIEVV
jgi:peptidylprolyl isomerase